MVKIKNKDEKILGPAIKILDDNNLSSKVYNKRYPAKHSDVDLSVSAFGIPFPTNVLNNCKNKNKIEHGYFTNKRIFITRSEFFLLGLI